jgi:tRNA pseudouridine32 synthase/23S rRNA pseudouridine746 synthase
MVALMPDATFAQDLQAPPVLWHDDALIVVDKPAGQLAVPGRGGALADCTWARVRALWPDALVVHRLDQATSGLLLFARGAAVQRTLSRAFAERRVDKRYVAVVHGLLADDAGRIDFPLAADWPRRPRQRVDPAGKPATTLYTVLVRERDLQRTRVALQPLTGRTHQLRVHLAAISHPVVGDALYAAEHAGAPRLLLHAEALQLAHPLDGRPLHLFRAAPF